MKTAITLLAFVFVYIILVVVVYRVIFNRIKPGDEVFIFPEHDSFYETDLVIWKDEENDTIHTAYHGDFNLWDFVKGKVSVKNSF